MLAISVSVFGVIAYISGRVDFTDYLYIAYLPLASELTIFATAFFGGCLGFLWFNAKPAEIFMGDVGSLSTGAALGTLAILLKKEVLLLTDRIDEWLMATLMNFKGKELVNVAKDINVDEEKPNISDSDQDFLTKVKNALDDKISDVVVSTRLVDSATCLRLPSNEPGAQLRKILEASGQTLGEFKPILEVNLKHKLLKKLQGLNNKEFNAFVEFLYDYAVIAEGGSPKDPSKYLRQLDKYLS